MILDRKKTNFFKRAILDFVRKAGREHLPWRYSPLQGVASDKQESITAYEVWVSEVMLQQTQVSRVIGYYEKFLERFPVVESLARVSWNEFLPYYAGLGYYQRGRNMLATARVIASEYAGEFPRDKKLLLQLPGVGDYTASAILSFAYNEPYLAYDTNLYRVLGRFFFGMKKTLDEEQKKIFQEKFKKNAREMNAGLMDFGSSICTGRPKCATCPLASKCLYFVQEGKREQSLKKKKVIDDSIDWKNAGVLVFLHEKRKKYFSSQMENFEPFILSAAYNTRSGIKECFRARYQLELAVRPPHKRIIFKQKPFLLVNAQILLGIPTFTVFPSGDVKDYLKRLK